MLLLVGAGDDDSMTHQPGVAPFLPINQRNCRVVELDDKGAETDRYREHTVGAPQGLDWIGLDSITHT